MQEMTSRSRTGRTADIGPTTRQRILTIAADLIATRTYAGTSMADIAERLGTSKAALYYHFKAKEDILDELLAEPAATLTTLAERAAQTRPRAEPAELLGGLIDLFAGSKTAAALFGSDASALADYVRRHNPEQKISQILDALAGPRASTASRIRARAALAAAKDGTATTLAIDGRVSPQTHAEILATALRALGDASG